MISVELRRIPQTARRVAGLSGIRQFGFLLHPRQYRTELSEVVMHYRSPAFAVMMRLIHGLTSSPRSICS
jgi:hypothetical protein